MGEVWIDHVESGAHQRFLRADVRHIGRLAGLRCTAEEKRRVLLEAITARDKVNHDTVVVTHKFVTKKDAILAWPDETGSHRLRKTRRSPNLFLN